MGVDESAADGGRAAEAGEDAGSLRLSLPNRRAAEACDELERLGFMVTGVVPGGPDADWLLLQFHQGILVDYDGMVVDSEEARELLAVVRAGDRSAE